MGLLVVNPGLPIHSVAELIEAAKAGPGKVSVASAGVGNGRRFDLRCLVRVAAARKHR